MLIYPVFLGRNTSYTNRGEQLTSTLFDLKKTLARLGYYVVRSQRSSLKIPKVDISSSKG